MAKGKERVSDKDIESDVERPEHGLKIATHLPHVIPSESSSRGIPPFEDSVGMTKLYEPYKLYTPQH